MGSRKLLRLWSTNEAGMNDWNRCCVRLLLFPLISMKLTDSIFWPGERMPDWPKPTHCRYDAKASAGQRRLKPFVTPHSILSEIPQSKRSTKETIATKEETKGWDAFKPIGDKCDKNTNYRVNPSGKYCECLPASLFPHPPKENKNPHCLRKV